MKRVLSVLLTLVMTVGCCYFGLTNEGEVTEEVAKEKPQIVETQVHYLTDEELSRLYTCKQDYHNDTCINLTTDEATLLMQIAKAESDGSIKGQLWVMCSIVNRVKQGYGNSIWEVVSAENQYTVFSTGRYLKADVDFNSHYALVLLEKGYEPTDGAIFFEAGTNSSKSWHKLNREFVGEAGGNLFYK